MVEPNRVKLLIDTHILFWWLTDDPRLSPSVRSVMIAAENDVFVSAASIWEMAIKAKLGTWPQVIPLLHDVDGLLRAESFAPLPVTLDHARAAGLLDWEHRDPFDRMLAAQAIAEGLGLVSVDKSFARAPIELFRA